ncbi:MAG: hypothetical protein M3Q76_04655 [Acidobacteriota bacterium]|nr:hypothetical protein [Acidobacteriota bacterium]
MGVVTLEGIVEQGQIKITSSIRLPEHTKVYIVVPDAEVEHTVHLHTPRLAHSEEVADFTMEIIAASGKPIVCLASGF